MRISVLTTKASLAAGDLVGIQQNVEGISFRELMNDVHSIAVLARSNVANVKFGVFLKDPTASRSFTHLCALGAANTFSLFTIPNIPIFPSAGTFTSAPGAVGYLIGICLAAGTTYTSGANDSWQSANFNGAFGQDNFMANAVNSYVDLAFIQHSPGSNADLLDKPFSQNYDESLRYFCKSYDYETAAGATTGTTDVALVQQSTTLCYGQVRFPKAMAKIPTVTAYNPATGTANSGRLAGGTDYAVSAIAAGKGGFLNITTATLPTVAAGAVFRINYVADTGW